MIIMQYETTRPKIIILGIGNLLLGDEGVGIQLIRMLNNDDLNYANLEIIDGGICPEIVSFVEDVYKLIIVDAIKGGEKPGTLYRLSIDDLIMDPSTRGLSLHEMGVLDSLKMMRLLGREPKNTIIIGIEPKNIGWGLELSPEVEGRLAELKRMVIAEIGRTK